MLRSLGFCFIFILFWFLGFSQDLKNNHTHQTKVNFSGKTIKDLINLGIAIDHGIHVPGKYFVGDFSHHELEKIEKAGFKMEAYFPNEIAMPRGGSVICNEILESIPDFPLPANYPYGSMAGFPNLQEMYESLDDMRSQYPKLASLRRAISTMKTEEGRTIFYVKISDNPDIDENEPEILYTAMHHAREPLSMSQLLYFMWYLLENYDNKPEVKKLVDSRELFFITCLNPDGYEHNRITNPSGNGYWRKNRKDNKDGTYGVDLNRNYGFAWGYDNVGSSRDGNNETYRGGNAFSESETKNLQEFIINREFSVALNYHTWGDLLIIPWGYSNQLCEDSTLYLSMAREMTKYNKFKVGTTGSTLNYSVNGTSDDWMYGEVLKKKKIFAFTPEVGYAFWPERIDILKLNKSTQYMNVISAWNAGSCAMIKRDYTNGLDMTSKKIELEIMRTGAKDGPITITPSCNHPGIEFQKTEFVFNLTPGEVRTVSLDFNYTITPLNGDSIIFSYILKTGEYEEVMTQKKFFYSRAYWEETATDISKWFVPANNPWIIDSKDFISPPSSFKDNANNKVVPNTTVEMKTSRHIDLKNAVKAVLGFHAKWDLDAEKEFGQVLISEDDLNFFPLCGQYTTSGGIFQDSGNPLYSGTQNNWVQEWIDLNNYIGKRIYLKILVTSNSNITTHKGMNIDDIKVYVKSLVDSKDENIHSSDITITPSIINNFGTIESDTKFIESISSISLTDLHSKVVPVTFVKKNNIITFHIDDALSSGLYFINLTTKENKVSTKKIIISKNRN